ncbi:hypothetical protein GFM44_37135 [Rhizobium leguminosarum bv. viciae]|nr:hypothetical protein [Rhizobium leguminosarum bv. viciae]
MRGDKLAIDESPGLLAQNSSDKPGGALHDRTLLTEVWEMQRGLIPSCGPISTAVEEILRRAFRG